jgi:hypothetical protein
LRLVVSKKTHLREKRSSLLQETDWILPREGD